MPSPQLFDLIQLILDLKRDSEGQKNDSPIILTDESSLVERSFELSNLIWMRLDSSFLRTKGITEPHKTW